MSKIYTSSNKDKDKFIDRFFLSYTAEEEWLNEMASKGLYLKKKSFYRYYFTEGRDIDAKYTVEILDHPADNPLCESYINQKKSKGAELVTHYRCRAYFRVPKVNYNSASAAAKHTRKKTVSYMFAAYLIAFLASVVMFCYHCVSSLNFTVNGSSETMHSLTEKFPVFGIFEKIADVLSIDSLLGNYQSTPVAVMFFILAAALSVPTAIYFRELYINMNKKGAKSTEKKALASNGKRDGKKK